MHSNLFVLADHGVPEIDNLDSSPAQFSEASYRKRYAKGRFMLLALMKEGMTYQLRLCSIYHDYAIGTSNTVFTLV